MNQSYLLKCFEEINRADFLDFHKEMAHYDGPLPIGFEQTISQPSLVLDMTLKLDVNESSRILEIGTGSGYQTALLSKMGLKVYTIERIEPLLEKAIERLTRLGYDNIEFLLGDGTQGWREHAPYDRIMVTAAAKEVPDALLEQLAFGGKMVIPVGVGIQDLLLIEKDNEGKILKTNLYSVRFVPLIGKY